IESLHALGANQDVLNRIVQGMPKMQCTGDVRRRNHDRIRLALRVRLAMKIALLLPEAIPALLGAGVMILFRQLLLTGGRHGSCVLRSGMSGPTLNEGFRNRGTPFRRDKIAGAA